MKRTNIFSSAIVVGATSACLVAGGAVAQPGSSEVNDATNKVVDSINKSADKTAQKAKEKAKTKSKAKAKAEKNAKAKAQNKAQVKSDAGNQNIEANADTKAKAKADAQAKAKADRQQSAKVKQSGKQKAQAKSNTKAKAKANARKSRKGSSNANTRVNEQLGIRFSDQDNNALRINSIQNGSIAANAGLRQGDQIVSIDGRSFSSQAKMNTYLSGLEKNRARVIFGRNGQRYRTYLTWNDRQLTHRARKPRLNTYFTSGNRGIVIDQLPKDGPIRSSGLQPGDEIVCFNGFAYRNVDRFVTNMNRLPKGRPIPVNVMRDGRLVSTRMTLAPQSRTYADRTNRNRPMAEGRNRGNTPPPPRPKEFNDQNPASQNADGRRTALRPNLEEMSTQQLRQRVQALRQENQKLKKQLNKFQENSSSDRSSKSDRSSQANAKSSDKSQKQSSSSSKKDSSKN